MPNELLFKKVQKAREDAFWANVKAMTKEISAIKAREQARLKSEEYAELRFAEEMIIHLRNNESVDSQK